MPPCISGCRARLSQVRSSAEGPPRPHAHALVRGQPPPRGTDQRPRAAPASCGVGSGRSPVPPRRGAGRRHKVTSETVSVARDALLATEHTALVELALDEDETLPFGCAKTKGRSGLVERRRAFDRETAHPPFEACEVARRVGAHDAFTITAVRSGIASPRPPRWISPVRSCDSSRPLRAARCEKPSCAHATRRHSLYGQDVCGRPRRERRHQRERAENAAVSSSVATRMRPSASRRMSTPSPRRKNVRSRRFTSISLRLIGIAHARARVTLFGRPPGRGGYSHTRRWSHRGAVRDVSTRHTRLVRPRHLVRSTLDSLPVGSLE
jgi:hypothetical protein